MLWKESKALEMELSHSYDTFEDLGKGGKAPDGYKKITCHLVYDVKPDGHHKARIMAGGHLTDPPLTSVYSGVVSLCSIQLIVFLAELNGLELWGADISNTYLEAKTNEKVYIIAGPEFSKLEGHTVIIIKALYGLHTSGL